MNREILLEVSIAIAVGLLIAVLAAYRSTKQPSAGVLRRGAVATLLIYAVIAVTTLVGGGMTLVGLVILLVLLLIPALANHRAPAPTGQRERLLGAAVGVGIGAAMLIAAGQTLAMLGRVDPRMVVLVIVSIAALLVAGQGLAAAGRVGSVTVWLMIVPILLSLALGLFVGAAGQAIDPIIAVPELDWWQVLGMAVAFAALGWADAALGSLRRAGSSNPVRVWFSAALVVAFVAAGQLMFLGGAVISPSLQFFVFPSNIDIVPGLAGVLLAVVTVLFTALVTLAFSGIGEGSPTSKWLVGGATLAALIALVDPGMNTVVVVTSLLAAALLGAQVGGSDRGVMPGLVAAVIGAAVLLVFDMGNFGWASAVAAALIAMIAFAVSRSGEQVGSDRQVEAAPQPPQ